MSQVKKLFHTKPRDLRTALRLLIMTDNKKEQKQAEAMKSSQRVTKHEAKITGKPSAPAKPTKKSDRTT